MQKEKLKCGASKDVLYETCTPSVIEITGTRVICNQQNLNTLLLHRHTTKLDTPTEHSYLMCMESLTFLRKSLQEMVQQNMLLKSNISFFMIPTNAQTIL